MPDPPDSHLPLGREPGPQSLRAAPDDGGDGGTGALLPLMAILFLACFIAIPLVVISVTEAQGVIYPVLGALAVAFVVAMWLLARRFRSREVVQYEVLAEPLELWRGDEVEAELIVYEPYRLAGRLEVGVVCVERYERPAPEGGEDADGRELAEDIAYERWLPARRTEEEQRFRFRIPPEAPYSHEGECLSFAWRVSARDADGAEESRSDDPIWVLP